jgi:hypothetical protein
LVRISFEVSTNSDEEGGVQVDVYLDGEGRDALVKSLSPEREG